MTLIIIAIFNFLLFEKRHTPNSASRVYIDRINARPSPTLIKLRNKSGNVYLFMFS